METGSTTTIVDKETYNKMVRPKIKLTNMKIFAFKAGSPIPLKGECMVKISINSGSTIDEKIYITADENEGCILSFEAARKLKLVRLSREVTVAAILARKRKKR